MAATAAAAPPDTGLFQGYEGKDYKHHLPRPHVVQHLLDLAFHRRALIIRAPPMSGKTALLAHLADVVSGGGTAFSRAVYVQRGDVSVLRDCATPVLWDRWLWSDEASAEPVLYLVDEADWAYGDPEHPLWRAIKTMLGDRRSQARVICAAVYERSLTDDLIRPSPSKFQWGAELDLSDLLFSNEECCALSASLGFEEKLAEPVGNAVFAWTSGSPGLVRASLDFLKDRYLALGEDDRTRIKPEYFLVSSAYVDAMSRLRAFEGLRGLQAKVVRLLRIIDRRESFLRSMLPRHGYEGVLNVLLRITFASHLIRTVIRIKMWTISQPAEISMAPPFEDFVLSSLRGMKVDQLFFPQVSAIVGAVGRVDYYVNSEAMACRVHKGHCV
eukprot:m51a1_g6127 hypothetical protein (385) ;mRNA; f:208871-210844